MAKGATRSGADGNVIGEALRRDGRRMTAQRSLLLRIIEEADEHLDAEAIHRRARERGLHISLSTVYRTLKVLTAMGMLRELHFDEEHHHFERALGEHYHLCCLKCGEVTEYWPADGGARLHQMAERCAFEIVTARLELQGLCKRCRRGRAAPTEGDPLRDDGSPEDVRLQR